MWICVGYAFPSLNSHLSLPPPLPHAARGLPTVALKGLEVCTYSKQTDRKSGLRLLFLSHLRGLRNGREGSQRDPELLGLNYMTCHPETRLSAGDARGGGEASNLGQGAYVNRYGTRDGDKGGRGGP